MDFGTVRKKLESGAYKNLDELEVGLMRIGTFKLIIMLYMLPLSQFFFGGWRVWWVKVT